MKHNISQIVENENFAEIELGGLYDHPDSPDILSIVLKKL
jgi:hypothetical protein